MPVNMPNLILYISTGGKIGILYIIITRILGTFIEDKKFENKGGKRLFEFNTVLTSSFISVNNKFYYLVIRSSERHETTT